MGSSGNVRAMLARKTSCTTNAISLLRAAEKQQHEVAKKMLVQQPLLGSAGVVGVPHVTNCSVVWNFAQNQEGAKQFLHDFNIWTLRVHSEIRMFRSRRSYRSVRTGTSKNRS